MPRTINHRIVIGSEHLPHLFDAPSHLVLPESRSNFHVRTLLCSLRICGRLRLVKGSSPVFHKERSACRMFWTMWPKVWREAHIFPVAHSHCRAD